jgi:hypothetical protein
VHLKANTNYKKGEIRMKFMKAGLLFLAIAFVQTSQVDAFSFGDFNLGDAFKSVGSKLSSVTSGIKNQFSKLSKCGAGNGEKPGAALYGMAKKGVKLQDASFIVAHLDKGAQNKHVARSSKRGGPKGGRRK